MSRMRLALFSNREKAEPIRARLAAAGMTPEIHEDVRLERLWFVSRRKVGARLDVPADQFERAEELLLNWDSAGGALREAIRCPECKSLRVKYPQFTRNSLLTNLLPGFLSLLGFVKRECYCEDCHFTWPREGSRARRERSHEAPDYFIEGVAQPGPADSSAAANRHDQPRKAA